MCFTGWRSCSVVWFAMLVGVTGALVAQVPRGFKAPTATLVGRVVDTAGAAIANAEVLVTLRGDSAIVKAAKSNKKGSITLRDLAPDSHYIVTARKVGYGPAQGSVQLRGGDTLYIDFELPPLTTTLAPIVVKARRSRLSIAADQFDPRLYRDALSLLAQKRRDMLGDPERCPLPDSVLGGPGRDKTERFKITDRLMLFGGEGPSRKRPWLDSVNTYIQVPNLPYVQQVYVNGVRVDWPKIKGMDSALHSVPGRSVVEELHNIPIDQIAEIRYADCWDESVPFYQRYALYVILKPPSQAVQDSIVRALLRDSTHP